ncbi:hypothetical protein KR026_002081 [Drosophila bipectinata]|nr:hypothetical protein KR026_002081 [Drosophila bipectinata]
MPLYSDTTNYYYSGGSSQLYSPYYSSGLGLNLPGSSSYTSSYNRSYPASYMVPLSPSSPRSPSYTSGSSSSSSSSLHGLGSRYQPKLTTITESGRHSGHSSLMPLTRIQSPKYTSTSYTSTTPTTRYIPPRPIAINTADIDVSSSRYRRGVTPKSNEKDDKDKDKDKDKEKEKDKDKDKDKDKKQDTKTETKEEPPKENFLEVPESGPKRRSTIRRNRAVVRLSTIRRRSKDRSEDTTTSKTEPIQPPEHQFRDLPPATEPSLSWRQKLAEELAAFPVTSNKKSPGELLRERFYIRDGTEEAPVANQAQVQELIQPQSAQKSEAPKEEQNQKNDQEKDDSESLDDQEELEEMQQKIRRLSLVQCPTFHDICEDISSDKIDDDLNAGELRRRASIIQEQEQEILNKLQKSSSGSFQMIHLERRSSHDSTTTADESGTERSKRRSKKSKKLRHKITAIVEVENAPAVPSAKVEHMPSVLELNEEPAGANQGLVSTSGSSSTPSPSPKPKFTVNVETVEEHHQIHKVFKLPKKKQEPALPEGFMKAAPKTNKTSPLKKVLPKPVEKKEPPPQQHVSVAQIFTFDEAAIQKQEPEKKEPKVEGVATPKPIRKAIQKSESGEDFWSQIGSRETLYMTNRKKALTERQDRLLEEEQQPQSPTTPKETKTIVEEAKTKVPDTKTPTVPKLKSEITIELKSTPTVTTSKTSVTPQTPEISTTKPGTTITTSNIENKATTTPTKPVTSPTSATTKPIVTPATSVDSPQTPTTPLVDAKTKTTATDVAKLKTTQAATKKDSPTKTKEEAKPKIAISKDNLIKIETKEAEKSKAAIPTAVQAKSVTPTLTPTTLDVKTTTKDNVEVTAAKSEKQSPKVKATTTIDVQTKPATSPSTPATPTQIKIQATKTEEIPLTPKTTIAAAKTTTKTTTTTTAVTVKQSGSTATSTAATPATAAATVAIPTSKSKLNETTGPKINSGQMAKSPEQQQAIETKINKTTHKEQQQQQQQQQLPAQQQQQQQKEQQSQTETKTKLTETAKSKVQSPKAGKINVAKKKATTPAATATAATSNTGATEDATTTESNVTPINADQFITLAPTKAAKISPTLQQQHASSQLKQSATTPTKEKQQQQQQSLDVAVKVATSDVATAIGDSGVAGVADVADVNVDNNSCGNNLSKFATVSNLAQCLRDVDAELEDYIPSSADNSDSETDSDTDGDSSAEYSSASGAPRRVLSESMKKKQRKEKRKQKKAAAAAADPPRFDPHKKIKIDTTNKCYVKEEAPRYPLVATPRPLWKREKIVYSDENTDDESESEAGSESLEEEATSDEESGEECSSSGSSQSSAGSAGAGGLRGGGGATKGGGSSSGVTESSTSSGAGAAVGATLGVVGTPAGTSPSIIRMSTCSNDSGFEGGTAPSSPKKMLETSYTYSQFQKSGRFTAPATVIPRFKNYSVDDFHFLAVLGKGSFGKVLLAELRDTTYYYAIKCLKKDVVLEDDDVDSTLIERKVLALGTKHPYLCHLFCTFQTESHLFFVMEYLNGGDLMFHIQESGRFSEERARFYGAEIISGLKFLHKKGIIYRDLKLDNVLLDYEGHVRIADFGMCKLQIYLDKTADSFCGTPDYMAPEIIKGEKYNQNVDWWSFGVLLYEMLIGQSPFSGCDEDELFWSICNEIPWFPVYISAEATGILKGLLEKDYTKRIGSQYSPAGDIADHIFFRPIDWGLLEKRQIEPPFKPQVKHPLDTQYFDRVFTRERVRLTPIDKEILASMDQKQFHGFTYTNPHITLD